MSDTDFMTFSRFFAVQIGSPDEQASIILAPWWNAFRQFNLNATKQVLQDILLKGKKTNRPGEVVAAIINELKAKGPKAKAEDFLACDQCRHTGFIEVPHPKDYEFGYWRGLHTAMVSCICERAIQCYRKKHMTIEVYEAQFPNWRLEYPIRQYENRIATMKQRLTLRNLGPHERDGLEKLLAINEKLLGELTSQIPT